MTGRTILFPLGATLLGCLLACVVGEAIVRGGRLYSATQFVAPHPLYGVQNIPHARGWYVKEEVRQYVTINGRGLRDRDQWSEGGGVLLLGDSFVAAFQVPLEASCQEVGERLLSRAFDRPVEITAAACNGWGTAHQLAFLCEEGFSYRPKAVVLALFPENDLLDNLGPAPRPARWPPPTRHAPPLLLPLFLRQEGGTALHRALAERLPPLARSLTPRAARAEEAQVRGLYHLWHREPTEIQRRMWSRLSELLAAMRDSVHARGASFGVLLVPGRLSLYPKEAQQLVREKRMLRTAALDPALPRTLLEALLDSLAIPYHDPSDAFMRLAAAGTDPLFRREGHWNIEGNRLAAEALASLVVMYRLLQPTAPEAETSLHRRDSAGSPPGLLGGGVSPR